RIALALEDPQGVVDERACAYRVAVALDCGFAERRKGKRLEDGLVVLVRLIPDLRHLQLHGAPVLKSPRGSRRDVPCTQGRPQLERAKTERARVRVCLPPN